MEHGSVLVMGPHTNSTCTHEVPASVAPSGKRISNIARACTNFINQRVHAKMRAEVEPTRRKNEAKIAAKTAARIATKIAAKRKGDPALAAAAARAAAPKRRRAEAAPVDDEEADSDGEAARAPTRPRAPPARPVATLKRHKSE